MTDPLAPICPHVNACVAGRTPSYQQWLDWTLIGHPLELARHGDAEPRPQTEQEWNTWLLARQRDLRQIGEWLQQQQGRCSQRPSVVDQEPHICTPEDLLLCAPALCLSYSTRMCQELPAVAKRFGLDRVHAGLGPLFLDLDLFDPRIPLPFALDFIEAQYAVFTAYAWEPNREPLEEKLYMWFDYLIPEPIRRNRHHPDPQDNSTHAAALANAFESVLTRILAIEDELLQSAALHGLGHLGHPDSARHVREFVAAHPGRFVDPAEMQWVQDCEAGTVL